MIFDGSGESNRKVFHAGSEVGSRLLVFELVLFSKRPGFGPLPYRPKYCGKHSLGISSDNRTLQLLVFVISSFSCFL